MTNSNYKFSPAYINKTFDLIMDSAQSCALEPGSSIGPLLREYHVIRLCESGMGVIDINGTKRTIRQGDGYVCMIGDVATETAVGDSPWVLNYMCFTGIKAEAYFKTVGVTHENCCNPPIITRELFDFARDICQNPYNYFPTTSIEDELQFIANGYSLFSLLAREHRKTSPEERNINVRDKYINEAMTYIELNLNNNLKIEDIASHVGLNTCYFQRMFREHTGKTPWEHIIRMRVSRACDLFQSPNATNESVANSIGWEPSVLYRNFKRITGTTPSEYRKRINKNRWQA